MPARTLKNSATVRGHCRPNDALGLRALNRATLERQMLMRRWQMPMLDAIERLVGLQAQTPHSWYHGLWTRLEGFQPERLAELLIKRKVVRIALMRSTIHLVTARDCLALRPLMQSVIERSTKGSFGRHWIGLDNEAVVAAGRALVEQQPRSFSELGKLLAERWPDRNPAALAQVIRAWLPLVQVPPRGLWAMSGTATHTTAEAWLGRPLATNPSIEKVILRYLAAIGPATVYPTRPGPPPTPRRRRASCTTTTICCSRMTTAPASLPTSTTSRASQWMARCPASFSLTASPTEPGRSTANAVPPSLTSSHSDDFPKRRPPH